MLPKYGFDWPPVPDTIEVPLRKGNLRIDYAYGAPTIGAAPTVARNTLWSFRYASGVLYGKPGTGAEIVILNQTNILEFGVCFDEDMYPVVTYRLVDGSSFYRVYDQVTKQYVITALPAGAASPRAVYDLKAVTAAGTAEVIIGYMMGKDIYVLQSSSGYTVARHAATYLQDLYLDQISFAVNNRLRFIMYQLTNPEHLPDANPIPQSKFSSFLYRRTYTGSTPPKLPDTVTTFSSSGLKYILTIKENNLNAEAVRVFPMSLCLRPEWVDELIATGQQSKPILKVTKTFSVGKDTEETFSLAQLTALGGMVYDPAIKLYRTKFDYATEGSNKRSIVVNITDLIVGERTTLIVDEDLKVKGDKQPIFIVADTPSELQPFLGSTTPLTVGQYRLSSSDEVSYRYVADTLDPPQWANESLTNYYPMLYLPKTIGISKAYVDTFTDPNQPIAHLFLDRLNKGNENSVFIINRPLLEGSLGQGVALVDGYYFIAMPLGPFVPSKAADGGFSCVALNEERTSMDLILDLNIRFSEKNLTFRRPSTLMENPNPLVPESSAVESLTTSKYTYTFNAGTNSGTGRMMPVDVMLPRAFFWPTDLLSPDQYYQTQFIWTESRWDDDNLVGELTAEHTVGVRSEKINTIENNYFVTVANIGEPAQGSGVKKTKVMLKIQRVVDGKTLEIEMNYSSPLPA